MTIARLLPLVLCVACSADKEDSAVDVDTGDTGTVERPDRPEACDPEVRVDGTPVAEAEPPAVGDQWYLLMYCDDALQTGTYVLQADPAESVSVDSDEPIVTFTTAGDVGLEYRIGSRSASFTVTVSD